jgi:hypothetical protein
VSAIGTSRCPLSFCNAKRQSDVRSVLCIRLPSILTHGVTPHLNAVGVVDQPVEDTVGKCGIADLLMPL